VTAPEHPTGGGGPAPRPWTPPAIDCDTARAALGALLIDEQDPTVDRRSLDAHLARCPTCAWPAALVGPATPRAPRRPARRRIRPGTGYLIALVLVVIGGVTLGPALYFRLQGAPPAKLTLPVGPGGSAGPLNGTWAVGRGSAAEYRVQEDLFGQQHLAVGRTGRVSGSITIAGATVTSGRIVVDLSAISSGNAGRDTVFRDHLLDTSAHPDAVFTLTRAIDLGTVPADGSTVHATAQGTLEMRGVTRPLAFPLLARRQGDRLDVTGDLTVRFARWHIPDPSFAITKVAPTGDIDLLVLFAHQGRG
jgi:polyisoprenoid-binding protein YceI